MKARRWIGLGVAATLFVVIGLGLGWSWWEHSMWRQRAMAASLTSDDRFDNDCSRGDYGRMGPGMMGNLEYAPDAFACDGDSRVAATTRGATIAASVADGDVCVSSEANGLLSDGEQLSVDEAYLAVESYLESWEAATFVIGEIMEFERNFYAIAEEADSGIGAMELLVDKVTGIVRPEFGPNMMWNARYGMHRRGGMTVRNSETNTITEAEAVEIAQRWLDRNRPGVTTEGHADPFYGYYTIHTIADDEIEGMLSVHGTTGQVWYHNWHGGFVQVVEGDDY